MNRKILIFGGASEGRIIAAALSGAGHDVTLSVATEYGREAADAAGAEVLAGRLGGGEMADYIKGGRFECVIDATHPYATVATQNVRLACSAAGTEYLRIFRPEAAGYPGAVYVPDAEAAAEALGVNGDKALLTIGSKGLEPFTRISGYEKKLYIRILPMAESLEKAYRLGFRGSNIICMQGPFDFDMNVATLKMTGARCLVTKEAGDAGG
ncbi:MAG: precorrin-6A reductase, partial [Nocardiopsaceae bacterium]|nr:precorrin-6A reductase [Nocardiopsaceae bacterium]